MLLNYGVREDSWESLGRQGRVWASSESWWWTGKPGMLQFMGSQSVRHDWVTEQLNWIEHVYFSSIYNSQDMEKHKVSTDGRNKEIVAYICVCVCVSMCLYICISHKKEGNPAICDNIDEFWGHYAKWSMLDRKRQIIYGVIHTKNLQNPNSEI